LSDTNTQSAHQKVRKYTVNDIPPEHFFSEPVYLDKNFILAAPEMPFTLEMIKALKEWEFTDVYSTGEPVDSYAIQKQDKAEGEDPLGAFNISDNDSDKISRAEEFYADFAKYVENVFNHAAAKHELHFSAIAEKIKEACDFIRENRRYLLRVQKSILCGPSDNYLISHTVKSTIISIIIGVRLKLPNHRLIELGVAAVLHEVGMVKLPPQIYLSKRPLESHEQKAILTHPVLGFNILKSFDFPLTVTLAALEHHERENGFGYPRQLTSDRISFYAKIIAVACSYEALSSKRPHKEAKNGYTGMLELLKNEGKQYDDAVVRALIYSLSIYPIGLHVLLSNGRKGQVVDVNPEDPRFPIVQIFGEFNPDGKNKVMETSAEGLSILHPLTKEEMLQDQD